LKRRISVDGRDDISKGNLARLKAIGSPKVMKEKYIMSDLKLVQNPEQMGAYRDTEYRNEIADRYGMFLLVNEQRFWTPYLKDFSLAPFTPSGLFKEYKENWEVLS
jgi:hypothetical protein